jgi:hypothetical protein
MSTCNTNVNMTLDSGSKKRSEMISLRLQDATQTAMIDLMDRHGVKNRTEYLHGLILLDAILSGYPTFDLDKPAWVSRAFLEIFKDMPASRRVSAETQEGIFAALRTVLKAAPSGAIEKLAEELKGLAGKYKEGEMHLKGGKKSA